MAEDNKITKPVSDEKKTWLEKQLEKISGEQENMQPVIKACLSVAGFIGGFVAGYFVFGREKDKKIHEQELLLIELKQTSKEQERDKKHCEKELEESKAKISRLETENKNLKEGDIGQSPVGALNGIIPLRRTERSYLD